MARAFRIRLAWGPEAPIDQALSETAVMVLCRYLTRPDVVERAAKAMCGAYCLELACECRKWRRLDKEVRAALASILGDADKPALRARQAGKTEK